ncbi:MAG TPA: ABC transporter permease [Chitinophagaceae bacterium]|nr:ABC transporter permease [Chitinophagaceae bacterium]
MKKNWGFTLVSVLGLTIGTGAFIILMNYAGFETHYDSFQNDRESIYRVEAWFAKAGVISDSWVTSSFGYGPAMKKEFPEVKEYVRINNYDCERMVKYKNIVHREPRVVAVDSNFFSFFDYKLLKGNVKNVLVNPNSVVLSQSAAKKYFGDEDPIGKFLDISTLLTKYHCVVTGVFEDFPVQSHIHLDIMFSYSTLDKWQWDTWYMHEAYTYVKVNTRAEADAVERKFPQLAEEYKNLPALKEKTWGVYLVPLTSIHLNAFKPYEREAKGSRQTINYILVIAVIILIIGWVNFINTLISKAMERAGEIGVRKMAGAGNREIFMQFFVEAVLVNIAALILFFLFMLVFIPLFKNVSEENIFYHFWQRPLVWQLIAATFASGIIITTAIPYYILKRVNTALVLKNRLAFGGGFGRLPRLALIVFQYFIAMVLIVAAITARRQLVYMQYLDLGVGINQTLVFKTPAITDNYNANLAALEQNLKGISGVKAITTSSTIPGRSEPYIMSNTRDNDPLKTTRLDDMIRVDWDFIPAYNLAILKGRNFSRNSPSDTATAVILTENAMQLFGFKNAEDAVHKYINLEGRGNDRFEVIGVVKDFHQLSLKEGYRPIVFLMYNPWNSVNMQFVSVKLQGADAGAVMAAVKKQFTKIFPASSFDAFFLDDYFNAQYSDDMKYQSIVTVFTWLALIIVCLGIFGLSSFMLIKRTKEIAIRKVIGAGIVQILRLMNTDFMLCIAVAFVIAMPAAWYFMHIWLQNFTYRTNLAWWLFLLPPAITICITVLTVSAIAFKTAASNPVVNLKAE